MTVVAVVVLLLIFGVGSPPVECATFGDNVFTAFSGACRFAMKFYPMENAISEAPSKLYMVWLTPQNDNYRLPIVDAASMISESSLFDGLHDTVIIIHGFNDSPNSALPAAIADAYLELQRYNVLLLDSRDVISGSYPMVAQLSRPIGEALSKFLIDMRVVPEKVHMIGISLGAQIAGWTGRLYANQTGKQIGRITGLDPAGPCFTGAERGQYLSQEDATFVDVIHANQGVQGVIGKVGHADFFVNGGGPQQPGCYDSNCSHQRANLLYLASMDGNNSMPARKCDSWQSFTNGKCNRNEMADLGFRTSNSARGAFYLKTSAIPPFAMGMEGATGKLRSWYEAIVQALQLAG